MAPGLGVPGPNISARNRLLIHRCGSIPRAPRAPHGDGRRALPSWLRTNSCCSKHARSTPHRRSSPRTFEAGHPSLRTSAQAGSEQRLYPRKRCNPVASICRLVEQSTRARRAASQGSMQDSQAAVSAARQGWASVEINTKNGSICITYGRCIEMPSGLPVAQFVCSRSRHRSRARIAAMARARGPCSEVVE